ncbi:hypothetical protein AUO94_12295 [Planococcus kocurii]|uniref:Uncharacterized protein n=1 Tax=Planococcus kocurii TaxID=1374 RepID=A0ABM5WYA8_9BACL|nr:hypothetical protein AUO94_12295 [Planococcus kocurii]
MTRGSGRWSLDKEKRKRPCSTDRHKTDWQSGAFGRTAGMTYDPRCWAQEPRQRKAQIGTFLKVFCCKHKKENAHPRVRVF